MQQQRKFELNAVFLSRKKGWGTVDLSKGGESLCMGGGKEKYGIGRGELMSAHGVGNGGKKGGATKGKTKIYLSKR